MCKKKDPKAAGKHRLCFPGQQEGQGCQEGRQQRSPGQASVPSSLFYGSYMSCHCSGDMVPTCARWSQHKASGKGRKGGFGEFLSRLPGRLVFQKAGKGAGRDSDTPPGFGRGHWLPHQGHGNRSPALTVPGLEPQKHACYLGGSGCCAITVHAGPCSCASRRGAGQPPQLSLAEAEGRGLSTRRGLTRVRTGRTPSVRGPLGSMPFFRPPFPVFIMSSGAQKALTLREINLLPFSLVTSAFCVKSKNPSPNQEM